MIKLAEPVREDFLDFPTAWRICRAGIEHTDQSCSYVQASGAFLCDCGAVGTVWEQLVEAQKNAPRRDILDAIDAWHQTHPQIGEYAVPLPEYLSMTRDQYESWLETAELPAGSPYWVDSAESSVSTASPGVDHG